MRFFYLFLGCLLSLCVSNAQAVGKLQLNSAEINTGQQVSLSLHLVNDAPTVCAFQSDIQFAHPALAINAIHLAKKHSNHITLQWAAINDNTVRVVAYTKDCTGISSGEIATVNIAVADNAKPKRYKIPLHTAMASNRQGNAVPLNLAAGQITVKSDTSLIFPVPASNWIGLLLIGCLLIIATFYKRSNGLSVWLLVLAFGLFLPDAIDAKNGHTHAVDRMIDVILGKTPQTAQADCNQDGQVNALDITCELCHQSHGRNQPPVLAPIANRRVAENQPIALTAQATDIDGDTLTYDLNSTLTDIRIDANTGQISWPGGKVGNHTVTVSVSDGNHPAISQTFEIIVLKALPTNHPPTLEALGKRQVTVNTPVTTQLFGHDMDLGDAIRYHLDNAPSDMSIDENSGLIRWTPTTTGTYSITASVSDMAGLSASQQFIIVVTQQSSTPNTLTNHAPVLTVPKTVTLNVPYKKRGLSARSTNGQTLKHIKASATDKDMPNDQLTFTLLSGPDGLTVDANTGVINWTAKQPGQYTVRLKVTDRLGLQDVGSFVIKVQEKNGPPIAKDDEYTAHTTEKLVIPARGGVLHNDTDPDNDDITVTKILTQPKRGDVTLNENGAFEYHSFVTPTGKSDDKLVKNINLIKHSLSEIKLNDANAGTAYDRLIDGFITDSWISANSKSDTPRITLIFKKDVTPKKIRFFPGGHSTYWYSNTIEIKLYDINDNEIGKVISPAGTKSGTERWREIELKTNSGNYLTNVKKISISLSKHWMVYYTQINEIEVIGNGESTNFVPAEKWRFLGESCNYFTPYVADLENDGSPEIFVFKERQKPSFISGETGKILPSLQPIHFPPHSSSGYQNGPVLADINNDGNIELIYIYNKHVYVFSHKRELLWKSSDNDTLKSIGFFRQSALAVADLDQDSHPEIIGTSDKGLCAINADGTLKWCNNDVIFTGIINVPVIQYTPNQQSSVVIADINLDGKPEIITNKAVFSSMGQVLVKKDWKHGEHPAIANLDDDPFPELIFAGAGKITIVEHDFLTEKISWNLSSNARNNHKGGAATIADFDNDGQPEIGIAGSHFYQVWNPDGSLLWQKNIEDTSSSVTGSTVFDFEGDGINEVVYRDEKNLWVYRGTDGKVLFKYFVGSGTGYEYPIVADVDADGEAEIIVTQHKKTISPNGDLRGCGVVAFGSALGNWMPARKIWNQYSYHVTNINDDGTVPRVEKNNWLQPGLNNYRTQAFAVEDKRALADTFTYQITDGNGNTSTATVRINLFEPNTAPVITSEPDRTATLGFDYRYAVSAHDIDGDALTYALTNKPDGMTIDADSGLITWSPDKAGTVDVGIVVKDARGFKNGQGYQLTVSEPIKVPDLTGQTLDTIKQTLSNVGLTVGHVTESYDSYIPSGIFVASTPQTGTVAEPDIPVNIVLSKGQAPANEDRDNDGMTPAQGDCDDTNPAVYLGAPEVVGNTIDENCDGIAQDGHHALSLEHLGGTPLVGQTTQLRLFEIIGDQRKAVSHLASWSVDDATIASVAEGDVLGKQAGSVTVSVRYQGQTLSNTVRFADKISGDSNAPSLLLHTPVDNAVITEITPVTISVIDEALLDYRLTLKGAFGQQLLTSGNHAINKQAVATLNPANLAGGNYALTLSAVDQSGNSRTISSSFRINKPSITSMSVSPGKLKLLVKRSEQLTATGIWSDGKTTNITQQVTWVSADPSIATVSKGLLAGKSIGSTNVTASYQGANITLPVEVVDEIINDNRPPVANLLTPADGEQVTTQLIITGTATDAHFLHYRLEYTTGNSDHYTLIQQSDTPVEKAVLGKLDPTTLTNGLYTLRLTVTDKGSNVATALRSIIIDGDLKIGNFSIGFTDVTLPAPGMPLTVGRIYDTFRHQESQELGYGWQQTFAGIRAVTSGELGKGWYTKQKQVAIEPIAPWFKVTEYTTANRGEPIVSVIPTFGEVEHFRLTLRPRKQNIQPIRYVKVQFEPLDESSGSSLESLDYNADLRFIEQRGELYDEANTQTYSPARFKYTTEDGVAYIFHKDKGLEKVLLPDGNTLTYTQDGIKHSSGQSVVFTRDALGRITKITDPAGKTQIYTYDAHGDQVAHTDAMGNVTKFVYDAEHRLMEIHDPLGNRAMKNEYDKDGRLVAQIDADGNRIAYNYSPNDQKMEISDALGYPSKYKYDAKGNVTRQEKRVTIEGKTQTAVTTYEYDKDGNEKVIVNPDGVRTEQAFDSKKHVTRSVVDPQGLNLVTTYAYNDKGSLTTSTDEANRKTTVTYSTNGSTPTRIKTADMSFDLKLGKNDSLVGLKDSTGLTRNYERDSRDNVIKEETRGEQLLSRTEKTYDANGNVKTETHYRTVDGVLTGFTTTYQYDGNNRVTQTTNALGKVSKTEYDKNGNVVAEVDARGNRTQMTYDARGQLTKTTFADGMTESHTYDKNGNRLTTTDARGNTTTFGYDELDRQVSVTYADGSVTKSVYSLGGRLMATIDARGNRTDMKYNSADRLIQTTLPAVRDGLTGKMTRPTTSQTYNKVGQTLTMTDARGRVTTQSYDPTTGKLKTTTRADQVAIQHGYDDKGRPTKFYDALNRLTVHSLDAQGRITKVTLPQPNATATHPEHSYRYDLMGNLVAETDAKGQTTEYVYDALNRRIETRLANGQAERFAYDAVGNLTAHTLLSGEVITYRYDNRNRLKKRTLPDGSVTRWTYTQTGQIASVSDDVGTISYKYDVMDRVEHVQKSDGQTLDYGYDANGNLTKIQTANTTTTYGYDALNRMSTVTTVGLGSIDTTSYAYDLVGNVVTVSHGNGTQTSKRYDELNRVTSILSKNGATVISSQTYTYTLDNQVASITFDDGSVETFSYDGLNRLVKEVRTGTNPHSIDYTYDAVGNRTQKTESEAVSNYRYDNINRLISVTGAENYRFAYDANGNRTAVSGDDNRVYEWNALMQLTRVLGAANATYRYDALGHQIGKTTNGEAISYLVDAHNPTGYRQVIESKSGGKLSQNIFGNDLILTNSNTKKSYYHADKLGTVRATSNNSGTKQNTVNYASAYGKSSINADHFGFTGERFDSNANALYLRARYYDPVNGVFLSRDTFQGFMGNPLSRNGYLYTHGNPVNGIDPSGHMTLGELSATMNSAMNLSTSVVRFVKIYNKIENFLEVFEAVRNIHSAIRQVKDIKLPSAYKNTHSALNKFDVEAVVRDLMKNSGLLFIDSINEWGPYLLDKKITAFVYYLPQLLDLPLGVSGEIKFSKIGTRKIPLKLRFDNKGKGRITGFGVGIENKSYQIWRMDQHDLHLNRNPEKEVSYFVSPPYHYHINKHPRDAKGK